MVIVQYYAPCELNINTFWRPFEDFIEWLYRCIALRTQFSYVKKASIKFSNQRLHQQNKILTPESLVMFTWAFIV